MILVLFLISTKRTYKGYSEEHRMIKLEKFISLSGGKTVPGSFSIDWTKPLKGIKIPHRKHYCLKGINGKICTDCGKKAKKVV